MLFNPSQVYMPNRHRQRSAIRTFFPSSSFSPPDSKEPLRRGILFSSVAAVLLLVGAILTWLGFNDVFGGKISMTGPLLIALALLMLLLSLRQFMLARKRNRSPNGTVQMEAVSTGGVTAVLVDHDDGNGAATIVVETWESEEPNNGSISYRNNQDLAPPSYMDIAQSCSSNCPSFISHDDHNEAPPTYEETCGMYSSDISLTNGCSCGTSSQSPSPQRTSNSGYGFFQNDCTFMENYEMHGASDQPCNSSGMVCPRTSVSQCLSYHMPVTSTENNLPLLETVKDSQLARNTGGHSINYLPCTTEFARADNNSESCGANSKPSEWSRRSFSSIPSYTCLLSESGEVSSHVFDTSTIIEEMMPLLAVQAKLRDPTSADLLMGPTIIPTRSLSMSSVNTSRQGVPYNSHLHHSSQTTPRTITQPSHLHQDQQPLSGALSPSPLSHSNTSALISKSSSFPLRDPHLRQESDPNLVAPQPPPTESCVLLQQPSLTRGSVLPHSPLTSASVLPRPPLTSGSVLQQPSLTSGSVLPRPPLTSGSVLQQPSLTGGSVLPRPPLTGGSVLQQPSLTGGSVLPRPPLTGGSVLQQPSLTGGSVLPRPPLTGGSVLPQPSLTSGSVLQQPSLTGGSVLPRPPLTGGSVLPHPTLTGGSVQQPPQPPPTKGSVLQPPQPPPTSSFTSTLPTSWHISNSEEANEHEELTQVVPKRRTSQSSLRSASQDGATSSPGMLHNAQDVATPSPGMLHNTQDVQETI